MKKTILVIDDERAVRETLARFFSREGYDVVEAGGVKEARPLVSCADLVLSDIRLGNGENGLEFLEELRGGGLEKPALIMSGDASQTESEKAIVLTGRPVVSKPVDFNWLLEVVMEILGT